MNARQIIREAREQGVDPVGYTLDLADGFGWDEDMTDDALAAVESYLLTFMHAMDELRALAVPA